MKIGNVFVKSGANLPLTIELTREDVKMLDKMTVFAIIRSIGRFLPITVNSFFRSLPGFNGSTIPRECGTGIIPLAGIEIEI